MRAPNLARFLLRSQRQPPDGAAAAAPQPAPLHPALSGTAVAEGAPTPPPRPPRRQKRRRSEQYVAADADGPAAILPAEPGTRKPDRLDGAHASPAPDAALEEPLPPRCREVSGDEPVRGEAAPDTTHNASTAGAGLELHPHRWLAVPRLPLQDPGHSGGVAPPRTAATTATPTTPAAPPTTAASPHRAFLAAVQRRHARAVARLSRDLRADPAARAAALAAQQAGLASLLACYARVHGGGGTDDDSCDDEDSCDSAAGSPCGVEPTGNIDGSYDAASDDSTGKYRGGPVDGERRSIQVAATRMVATETATVSTGHEQPPSMSSPVDMAGEKASPSERRDEEDTAPPTKDAVMDSSMPPPRSSLTDNAVSSSETEPTSTTSDFWTCTQCTLNNARTRRHCEVCKARRPATATAIATEGPPPSQRRRRSPQASPGVASQCLLSQEAPPGETPEVAAHSPRTERIAGAALDSTGSLTTPDTISGAFSDRRLSTDGPRRLEAEEELDVMSQPFTEHTKATPQRFESQETIDPTMMLELAEENVLNGQPCSSGSFSSDHQKKHKPKQEVGHDAVLSAPWQSNRASRRFLRELEAAEASAKQSRTGAFRTAGAAVEWQQTSRPRPKPFGNNRDDDAPRYAYHEVVRGRARQALPAHDCAECAAFYDSLIVTESQLAEQRNDPRQFCRHRSRCGPPPETPEGFWEIDFIDEKRAREKTEAEKQMTGN